MMHARPAVITPRYCALVFNAYDWNRREIMCVQPRVVKAHSDVADLSHPRGWPRARPPVREVPAVCRYPQVSAVNRVRCGVPRHEPGRESATRQLLLLLPATDARAHIDRTARVHDKFIFRELPALRRQIGANRFLRRLRLPVSNMHSTAPVLLESVPKTFLETTET